MTVYEKAGTALVPRFKDPQTTARFGHLRTFKALRWEAERSFVMQLMMRNDALAGAAADNPDSVINCMLDAAQIGLSFSPTSKHLYLIPESVNRQTFVKLAVSYMGLENLVLRSGAVKSIQTELVYENDTFRRGENENGAFVEFEMARGERGSLQGGYCRATLKNGQKHVEWMSAAELDACEQQAILRSSKDPSKRKAPPSWRGPFRGEMYKKCIVRRAAKHWVLEEALLAQFAKIDEVEPAEFVDAGTAVVALMTDEHREAIYKALREKGMVDDHISIWIGKQTEAWGSSPDKFPDEGWERLRDALLERRAKLDAMELQPKDQPVEAKPKTRSRKRESGNRKGVEKPVRQDQAGPAAGAGEGEGGVHAGGRGVHQGGSGDGDEGKGAAGGS